MSANLMVVGSANNVGISDPQTGQTNDVGLLGGWSMKSLALDPRGILWGVGTSGTLGSWDELWLGWAGTKQFGGWTFNSLAWAPDNALWCVGSAGNLSKWRGNWAANSGGWTGGGQGIHELDNAGGAWSMVAFAGTGMWGVRDGDIVKWDGSTWSKNGFAQLPGVKAQMISFAGGVWAVGTNFQVYKAVGYPNISRWDPFVLGGWTVRWIGPQGGPLIIGG